MPIYEFKCTNCQAKFELLCQRDSQEIICPECGSREIKRLFSTFGVIGAESTSGYSAGSSKGCSGCSGKTCSTCH